MRSALATAESSTSLPGAKAGVDASGDELVELAKEQRTLPTNVGQDHVIVVAEDLKVVEQDA